MRENIEGKNHTIASVLNELAGQGQLRRRRKGQQSVLLSLASKEMAGKEDSHETGSPMERRQPEPFLSTENELEQEIAARSLPQFWSGRFR